jgi:HK97 family phage major capsid protein
MKMVPMTSLLALRASLPVCATLFNESNTLVMLRQRLADLQASALSIQGAADAGNRDFTTDEERDLADIFASIEKTNGDITRRERIEVNNGVVTASQGRRVEPGEIEPPDSIDPKNIGAGGPRTPGGRVPAQPINHGDLNRQGFRNMGDFAKSVMAASRPGASQVDPRLLIAGPATFGSEGTGADGGFAVPPEFRTSIMEKVMGETSLLARTDLIDVTGNTMTIPKDETTPWQSSGGIQAYWEGEAQQFTQSKPALEDTTIRLNKLTALVPVTSELLEDAAALSSYINRKAPEKIDFKVNLAIIGGTGVGQPLGILNSPALVSVPKDTSQIAATITHSNIVRMWARLYGPSRQNAVWIANQDVEPQLNAMGFPTGATTVQFPVYLPPGGVSGAPYSTLMGRPIIPSQASSTLGTQGDLILTDLQAYLAAQKVGGLRAETSIHLWFDYDVTAFRFVLRLAGQPWWSNPITPLNGSNTLSQYVTLDTRT